MAIRYIYESALVPVAYCSTVRRRGEQLIFNGPCSNKRFRVTFFGVSTFHPCGNYFWISGGRRKIGIVVSESHSGRCFASQSSLLLSTWLGTTISSTSEISQIRDLNDSYDLYENLRHLFDVSVQRKIVDLDRIGRPNAQVKT